ncbi:hypothetical protein PFICI_10861 [Pestalotiopsis fici W106-1]|uniref:Uncharacterized protein n=1 Tax=Pestalotiopsis fici (strain W106-1 / CGMCC3.15140) TaxID=1229662 RepID=W3WV17_PESFW|nr:uncharacterized protein PFICI_10861 [Pestalotiopsis fici W106-1]ETS76987.1 hypothetical protein PFICI_10861 [Pestalotiopsis fici W106-1]
MTAGWRSGARGYPHRYYDDNTFVSSVNAGEADTSIFYEYPILPDATYTEGRPGLDRVIFDRNGNFITIIAHETRQNANDFRVGFEAGPNDWNQIELQNTNGIGSWQRWLSNHAARGGLQFVIGYAFADKAVQFWPRGN